MALGVVELAQWQPHIIYTHMHIYRAWLATREKLDLVVQWGCRETLGRRGTRAHRDCKEMK